MRRITFTIQGKTDAHARAFENAIDLAVERLHDEHKDVGYSVRYERIVVKDRGSESAVTQEQS